MTRSLQCLVSMVELDKYINEVLLSSQKNCMYRMNAENGDLKPTFKVFIRLKTQLTEVSFEKCQAT